MLHSESSANGEEIPGPGLAEDVQRYKAELSQAQVWGRVRMWVRDPGTDHRLEGSMLGDFRMCCFRWSSLLNEKCFTEWM